MNKSLQTALTKICTSGSDPLSVSPLMKHTSHLSLCSHPLFGLLKCSADVDECHWVLFFFTWRNLMTHLCFVHTSMSDANTASEVTWQQSVIEYWWEGPTSTSIPPTSASDVVGQYNKIGSCTFRAALQVVCLETGVCVCVWMWSITSASVMLFPSLLLPSTQEDSSHLPFCILTNDLIKGFPSSFRLCCES